MQQSPTELKATDTQVEIKNAIHALFEKHQVNGALIVLPKEVVPLNDITLCFPIMCNTHGIIFSSSDGTITVNGKNEYPSVEIYDQHTLYSYEQLLLLLETIRQMTKQIDRLRAYLPVETEKGSWFKWIQNKLKF